MISYYEPNFIEKYVWKSGFSIFAEKWRETKIGHLTAILKRYFFLYYIAGIRLFLVYK